ncbi:hypothetical protein LCI18_003634 [Fusarium solani-melongenae]|uniref:Uncharacterized protein n=1 Tax=Fusarium solani subsp. cucurbitae TaxID=2747967 RepID=A0ACD3YUR2_FUSSC|nr:hypothetical protein LCI18_003634 [Fusarium solani-melongenae]
MSIPKIHDVIRFEAYNQDSETKIATYYIVKAENTSKAIASVILYIQDYIYKDQGSADYIGKNPEVKREGDNWVVPITDRFQYDQKNHRFLITTIKGTAAEWAKTLANSVGAGELADTIDKLGISFVGGFLKTF